LPFSLLTDFRLQRAPFGELIKDQIIPLATIT
jgi:hypothetical protein